MPNATSAPVKKLLRGFIEPETLREMQGRVEQTCRKMPSPRIRLRDPYFSAFLPNLLPLAEELFGEVSPDYALTRSYLCGDRLEMHQDNYGFAIDVCVNQNVEWPLIIGNEEVFLNAGDAVAFDGARIFHGRPNPLSAPGSYYDICLFSFKDSLK